MSSQNHIQILDGNFLVSLSSGVLKFGSTTVAQNRRPITSKFGGGSSGVAGKTTNLTAIASNIKTELNSGEFINHSQYVIDFDPNSPQNIGLNNVVMRFSPTNLNPDYQVLAEVYEDFPSNYDAEANRPLETYWGYKVSDTYYYIYIPYYRGSVKYRIKIYNPNQPVPSVLTLMDLFMGVSVGVFRSPAQGLSHQATDRSVVFQSDSGRKYFLAKQKFNSITSLTIPIMDRFTKESLYEWSNRVGICTPFWVVLDPLNQWDAPSFGVSFGAYRLTALPIFSHQFYNYFSTSLSLEEVL